MTLTTTADAQTAVTPKTLAVLPPLEYDHPYEGRLTVKRMLRARLMAEVATRRDPEDDYAERRVEGAAISVTTRLSGDTQRQKT
jgi:hypothetical protein